MFPSCNQRSSIWVVCYIFVSASTVLSNGVVQHKLFEADDYVGDKVVIGDSDGDGAVVTVNDVTATHCAVLCANHPQCAFHFYRKSDRQCVLCSTCKAISLSSAPGFKFFALDAAPDYKPSSDENKCATGQPQNGCWQDVAGLLSYASLGPSGLWGVNHFLSVFTMVGTYQDPDSAGTQWQYLDGTNGVQVDVGRDIVWVVDSSGRLWSREGLDATSSPLGTGFGQVLSDECSWVSVSPGKDRLWVVNTTGHLLLARDPSHTVSAQDSTTWDVAATDMASVDAGFAGVWALDKDGSLFHMLGTFGDDSDITISGSGGSAWRRVQGTFRYVSSGRNLVVAITSAEQIWLRKGLSEGVPFGLAWERLPGVMKQAEIFQLDGDGASLWAVDNVNHTHFMSLE